MAKTYEIVLGERTFQVSSPVLLYQLRDIEDAANRVMRIRAEGGSTKVLYAAMADAILAAIVEKNPEFTREVFDRTPISPTAYLKAYTMAGVAAGIFEEEVKVAPEGEAKAESPTP